MRKLLATFMLLLWASVAMAANPICTLTGNVEGANGKPAPPRSKVCFSASTLQATGGSLIAPIAPYCVTLDASGNLPTVPAVTLPQGAFINISAGGGAPIQVQVPLMNTADIWTLMAANTDPPSLVSSVASGSSACTVINPSLGAIGTATITCAAAGSFPLPNNVSAAGFKITSQGTGTVNGDGIVFGQNSLADLAPSTGNYSMNTHKLTALASNSTGGDALSQGNSHLNDMAAATATYSMGGFGILSLGASTLSETTAPVGALTFDDLWADSTSHRLKTNPNNAGATNLIMGTDGINAMSAATGNYAMGSNKITGLAAGTLPGDALSLANNHLNDLASATGNYAMASNKITGEAAATASGDVLAGGVNNTVTGTQIGNLQIAAPTGGAKTNALNSQAGYYNNGNSAVEWTISTAGTYGNFTSTAGATLLQTCSKAVNAGTFTDLRCVTDLNAGTCTTAPTFNVRDNTGATTGTALACSTTAGSVSQAETLAVAAGDEVCIVRTVNGGTCTTPQFTITAHLQSP